MVSGVPVIDLFAGAGGMGIASELAGGDVRLSVELDPVCCQTLEANASVFSGHPVQADVCDLGGMELRRLAGLTQREPLVIVGGPPCQPFSKASYWTDPGHDSRYRRARARGLELARPAPITRPKADDRRSLLQEFWRLVTAAKADGFVMENVLSLLHPRNRKTFDELLVSFHDSGYQCTVVKANAANYGVPQLRRRLFVLGQRRETPSLPEITHRASGGDPADLPRAVGVRPFLKHFRSKRYFEPEEVVKGRWAEHLREVPPGWNYKHHTAWAEHPNPTFEAETRFWNFLLKLHPDKPSWTINANPGPWVGPFHWTSRRLRTLELAALQTFPSGYCFAGSYRERVRQIGNAVPPAMAALMIERVVAQIAGSARKQSRRKKEVAA